MENLPPPLSGNTPQGLREHYPVAQFELGSHRNFIYLILDWERREAAIVDPQSDLEPPLRALETHDFRLTSIFLTHTHFDHVAGVRELMHRYPGIPLNVHERDLHRLARAARESPAIHRNQNGEDLPVGSLRVRVLHTPGHSAGECCYFLPGNPPFLLTGDTVFIRDCGRTDFEDGSNEEMFQSLQAIRQLPPETVILPGHHYSPECASTLARELRDSAPFRCRSVAELAALP